MHIFNDVCLVSKLHVTKTLPKFDIEIIWINIWNAQSDMKAKYLVNRYSMSAIILLPFKKKI